MSDMARALTETVRSPVITASDPGYREARAVYHAMPTAGPPLWQRVDAADLLAVVAAIRDSDHGQG